MLQTGEWGECYARSEILTTRRRISIETTTQTTTRQFATTEVWRLTFFVQDVITNYNAKEEKDVNTKYDSCSNAIIIGIFCT